LISVELMLERLEEMRVATVQSQISNPEEKALEQILDFAMDNNLDNKQGVRLFGRNFYPFDPSEPQGYEYYLTLRGNINRSKGVIVRHMPEGLYATLRVRGLTNVSRGWYALFSMAESAGYTPVGVCRSVYGWVHNGFEEIVNWQQQMINPQEWIIDLWLQHRE
jgi:effector-binding domain-containing protein